MIGYTCRPHNQGAVWFAFAAEDQTDGKSAGISPIFLARIDCADLIWWTDLTAQTVVRLATKPIIKASEKAISEIVCDLSIFVYSSFNYFVILREFILCSC